MRSQEGDKMTIHPNEQSTHPFQFAGYGFPPPPLYMNAQEKSGTGDSSHDDDSDKSNEGDDGSASNDSNNNLKKGDESDDSTSESESEEDSDGSRSSSTSSDNSDDDTDDDDDSDKETSTTVPFPPPPFFPMMPFLPPQSMPGPGSIPFPPSGTHFPQQPPLAAMSKNVTQKKPIVPSKKQSTITSTSSALTPALQVPGTNGLLWPGLPQQQPGTKQTVETMIRGTKRRRTNDNHGMNVYHTKHDEKKDDPEIIVLSPTKTVPATVTKKKPPHRLVMKYPYLFELGVPLGDSKEDFKNREIALSQLVRFQSTEYLEKKKSKNESKNSNSDSSPSRVNEKDSSTAAEENTNTTKSNVDKETDNGKKKESGPKKGRRASTFSSLAVPRFVKIERNPLFRYDYLIPFAQRPWKSINAKEFPRQRDLYISASAIEAMLEIWFQMPENNNDVGDVEVVTLKERKEAAARYILKYLNLKYRDLYIELLPSKRELNKMKEKDAKKKAKTTATTEQDNDAHDKNKSDDDANAKNNDDNERGEEEEQVDDSMRMKSLIANAVIRDGSEPNRRNRQWNLMFQRLTDYKDCYGDFQIYMGQKAWENRDKSKDIKKHDDKIPIDWKKIKLERERLQQQQQQQPQDAQQHADNSNNETDMYRNVNQSFYNENVAKSAENQSDGGAKGDGPSRPYCNLLVSWVKAQRNLYRRKSPELTPKRIELLESIGFTWAKYPDIFLVETNVQYHKAVAAKLCFGLTSVDALVFCGFPEAEARWRRRKNLIRSHSANLYRPEAAGPKGQHIKAKIEYWMDKIYEADKRKDEDYFYSVLEEIYGPSDLLDEWYSAGRLTLNRLHPSKRRRTYETLSEDGKTYLCLRPTGADFGNKLTPY